MYCLFHDDITWCIEDGCPITDCYRNTANMMQHTGLHSYAFFKGTDECVRKDMDGCAEHCVHARECYDEYGDRNIARRELQERYCDNCIFASVEED